MNHMLSLKSIIDPSDAETRGRIALGLIRGCSSPIQVVRDPNTDFTQIALELLTPVMATSAPSSITTTDPTPANPPSRRITPTSQPIPLLSTPLARTYTHIHPLLLLTLSYLRFPSLVASPVPTLLSSLLLHAAAQLLWVVTCLPPHTHTSPLSKPHPKKLVAPGPKRRSVPKTASLWSTNIIVYPPLQFPQQKPPADTTARTPRPHPYHPTRRPRAHHPPHPLRRPAHDAPPAYGALRGAYGASGRSATFLCPWRGGPDVEGDWWGDAGF